ncbi:MAG: hypothetical protein MZW92_38400 [Comamonadaceae bacterium]|nr:hypothetical protein [Comamonadaceae bacterium]
MFFFLLFLALTFDTTGALPKRDNRARPHPAGRRPARRSGRRNNCIGCHTLLGEGAYFAPELGNVVHARCGTHGRSSRPSSSRRPAEGMPGRRSDAAVQSHRPGAGRPSPQFLKYTLRDQHGQVAAEHPGLIEA